MDEPFGAIDPITRARLQDEFLRILRDGALVQYATPEAILARPADLFVESFVGTDRALKRLALIRADGALEPLGATGPSHAIAAEASLRDALALMFETGADALAVTGPDGTVMGGVTLARIRAHTRTVDGASH